MGIGRISSVGVSGPVEGSGAAKPGPEAFLDLWLACPCVSSWVSLLSTESVTAIFEHLNVCISFFWNQTERQIIIKGTAEKIPENLSDGYFETRPKGSQLSTLVSHQSNIIENRSYLDNKLKELLTQGDKSINNIKKNLNNFGIQFKIKVATEQQKNRRIIQPAPKQQR